MNPRYGTGFLNDDAVYVITAKDFWHTKALHPLLGIKPDFPFPGLPLFLAPFAEIAAPNWLVLEWLTVFVATFSAFLISKLARRWLSPGEALFATFLYALNPIVTRLSGTVMPGVYFTLAAVAGFLMMAELLESPSLWKSLLMGFVVGWGTVTRPEGFVILLGVVVPLFFSPKGRVLLLRMLLPLAGWAAFLWLWFHSRRTAYTEFGGDLNALMAYWPDHPGEIIPFSFTLINVVLLESWKGLQLMPEAHAFFVATVLGFVYLGLFAAGTWNLFRVEPKSRFTLAGILIYFTSYTAIHIFWHVAEPRYLMPLMPFGFILAIRGTSWAFGRFKRKKIFYTLAFIVVLMPYAYRTYRGVYHSLGNPEERFSPPWRTLNWIKENTPADARMTSNIPSPIDLYTDRDCMGIVTVDSGDEFTYLLLRQRLSYVVLRDVKAVTPGIGTVADPNVVMDQYYRWLELYPERFSVVFRDEGEGALVARLDAPAHFRAAYEKYIVAAGHVNASRYTQALQVLDECIILCPQLAAAENLRGAILMLGRNSKEAEASFLAVLKIVPDSTNALLNLSNLYHQRGDAAKSAEFMLKASQASERSNNRTEFEQNAQTLKNLWRQGKSTIFIKLPHTQLYGQIKE